MATYVGFLRAINLGAKRKFPKDAIVAATEAAGFAGVTTHINTGNVRLETTMRSRARIEAALEAAYLDDRGFAVPTVVVSCAELVAITEDAERFATAGGRHYVSLLKETPTAETARTMEALSTQAEQVRVRGRAVHLMLGENYHEARLTNAAVEKVCGVATNRNLTVLKALATKWC